MRWTIANPIEKVYLHTDKPYYAAGDTIWFKAYVVTGSRNKPSTLSGAVYVDLIDAGDSVVHALKLPLFSGFAKGSLALASSLPEGNYRIRAYTQWMRNAGTDFFYEQLFSIGNADRESVIAKAWLQFSKDKQEKQQLWLQFRYANRADRIQNAKIDYTLKMDKHYYDGSGQTDNMGLFNINILGKVKNRPAQYKLESRLNLPAGGLVKRNFVIQNAPDSILVDFFPEGGNLVNGLQSRVAIKITDRLGKGLDAKGEIKDSAGQMVCSWSTIHAGMGEFNITPEKDLHYSAIIHFLDGTTASYPLPAASNSGQTLAVFPNTGTDSVLVRIQATANRLGPVQLLVYQKDELIYHIVTEQERPLLQLYLPKSRFPSGITHFTLFNSNDLPVAERIIFLRQPDSLHIEAFTAQLQHVRDSTTIRIQVNDANEQPTGAHLSMAVIDESRTPIDDERANTIFAQLLLSSDIRGYIEKPGYYFNGTSTAMEHLDLLLRTQGYRRYTWHAVLSNEIPKALYPPEPLLQNISGRLLTLRGKPVAKGKVMLFSTQIGSSLDTVTDEHGRFNFDNLIIQDSIRFSLQGRTKKGGDRVELQVDQITPPLVSTAKGLMAYQANINDAMTAYLKDHHSKDSALVIPDSSILLQEVEINEKKENYLYLGNVPISLKQIDHIIHPKSSDSCRTLLECIRRWVPNLTKGMEGLANSGNRDRSNIRPITSGQAVTDYFKAFQEQWNNNWGATTSYIINGKNVSIFYNGFSIGSDVLDKQERYDPDNIVAVYVKEFDGTGIYDPVMGDLRCFIYIKTRDGLRYPIFSGWSHQLLKPKGYSLVKEFYAPQYNHGTVEDKWADYRTTIFWNADVRTTKTGEAFVNYFNAGRPGTYRIIIEGINSQGQLGRQILRYQVE